MRVMRIQLYFCILTIAMCFIGGLSCQSRQEAFTQGRLETLCEASLPICKTRATCTLDDSSYISGIFPGSQSAVIYTPHPKTNIKVLLLLDKQIYPGTELMVRVYQIGCVEVKEEKWVDVDLFEQAGDDQIIELDFEVEGRGDHLLEIFSDATASYALGVKMSLRRDE